MEVESWWWGVNMGICFTNMFLKMSSPKCLSCCGGLNTTKRWGAPDMHRSAFVITMFTYLGAYLVPEHLHIPCWFGCDLKHWSREKMAVISQTTFSNAFYWIKMHEFRWKFHWTSLKGAVDNIPALVQIMAWRQTRGKPLSEPKMV